MNNSLSLDQLIAQYKIVSGEMSEAHERYFAGQISEDQLCRAVIAHDAFPLYLEGISDELCHGLFTATGHWAI